VPEYFLYDPRGEWLKPPLQGYRLKASVYELIPADAGGGIISQELGIRLILENGDLAMFDVATGERLMSQEEWARTLEEEVARLRESTKRTNGKTGRRGDK